MTCANTFTKIYYRYIVFCDNHMTPTVVRGYYYLNAPFIYKQMIFTY